MTTTVSMVKEAFWKILPHICFPVLLAFFVWSTAGFPLGGPVLASAGLLFLILYVPGKILKLLVHKETGILRNNQALVFAAASLFVLLWVTVILLWIFEYGVYAIVGIPAALLVGFALWQIWTNLRGDDPESF